MGSFVNDVTQRGGRVVGLFVMQVHKAFGIGCDRKGREVRKKPNFSDVISIHVYFCSLLHKMTIPV